MVLAPSDKPLTSPSLIFTFLKKYQLQNILTFYITSTTKNYYYSNKKIQYNIIFFSLFYTNYFYFISHQSLLTTIKKKKITSNKEKELSNEATMLNNSFLRYLFIYLSLLFYKSSNQQLKIPAARSLKWCSHRLSFLLANLMFETSVEYKS